VNGPALLASLILGAAVVVSPAPATGFGTVEGGGQHREHERITRAAVACRPRAGGERSVSPGVPSGGERSVSPGVSPGGERSVSPGVSPGGERSVSLGVSPGGERSVHQAEGSPRDCFEPRSIDQLAGHGAGFGAIGAPDRTEVSVPAAHCDDADFVTGDYPQSRDDATVRLLECVDHLRGRFREAVGRAGDLLDGQGRVVAAEVGLDNDCVYDATREERAKCTTLESLGRALHGVQDFYSHSSWADEADPARPIGPTNPKGLNLPAPSPVLELDGTGTPDVPEDLTTGCFAVPDSAPGVGRCGRRVTHAALNKDTGLIDPVTGATSGPATPRGRAGRNFEKAVTGAVIETRHQWRDFTGALRREYGPRRAATMTCALTHDLPAEECDGSGRTLLARSLSGVAIVLVLVAGAVWLHRRGAKPRVRRTGRRGFRRVWQR
jgi:hypothetical protein